MLSASVVYVPTSVHEYTNTTPSNRNKKKKCLWNGSASGINWPSKCALVNWLIGIVFTQSVRNERRYHPAKFTAVRWFNFMFRLLQIQMTSRAMPEHMNQAKSSAGILKMASWPHGTHTLLVMWIFPVPNRESKMGGLSVNYWREQHFFFKFYCKLFRDN